jgi:hypothetical protein
MTKSEIQKARIGTKIKIKPSYLKNYYSPSDEPEIYEFCSVKGTGFPEQRHRDDYFVRRSIGAGYKYKAKIISDMPRNVGEGLGFKIEIILPCKTKSTMWVHARDMVVVK